jgi:hypothetical protein
VSGWDAATLAARVADTGRRTRHPAASPDGTEVAAYASALPRRRRRALVLGMTPELRTLALERFDEVLAVDRSADAVSMYGHWPDASLRRRETVLRLDWMRVGHHLGEVDAILGDGVFGNLPDAAAHTELLRRLDRVLAAGGVLVTRQALADPSAVGAPRPHWRLLRERHRAGELDAAEFGFGTRLAGHLSCCWDEATGRLDNGSVFAAVRAEHAAGGYTDEERRAIDRYRFDGDNQLHTAHRWERLAGAAGFTVRTVPTRGRDWYRYYPVQVLARRSGGGRGR